MGKSICGYHGPVPEPSEGTCIFDILRKQNLFSCKINDIIMVVTCFSHVDSLVTYDSLLHYIIC